jgi:hypothetical protein
MRVLTKPTRGRIVLWSVLSLLWFLLLPQYLAAEPHLRHFSVVGAIFWLIVLVGPVSCLWMTWQNHRRTR